MTTEFGDEKFSMLFLLIRSHRCCIVAIFVVVDVPGVSVSSPSSILIGDHYKFGVAISNPIVWDWWCRPHTFAEINVEVPGRALRDLLILLRQCGRRIHFPCCARACVSNLHILSIGAKIFN